MRGPRTRRDLTWDTMEVRREILRRLEAKEITLAEFKAAQKNILGRRRGAKPQGVCAQVIADLEAK